MLKIRKNRKIGRFEWVTRVNAKTISSFAISRCPMKRIDLRMVFSTNEIGRKTILVVDFVDVYVGSPHVAKPLFRSGRMRGYVRTSFASPYCVSSRIISFLRHKSVPNVFPSRTLDLQNHTSQPVSTGDLRVGVVFFFFRFPR